MGEIAFPTSTAPGINPTEGGGRLINAFAERAAGRSEWRWPRVPGLVSAFETGAHRGAQLVGDTLYDFSGNGGFSVIKSGGAYIKTALSGAAIGGSGPIFAARNMAAIPHLLLVHSSGMSQVDTATGVISAFSDPDLPAVNGICFLDGYFVVTSAAGKAYASGLNAVTFAGTDVATAEADPDGLVRPIARNRDLMLMGVATTEFWNNVGNPTGFPFQRSAVIPYGLLTATAVAGHETGWGNTPIWVANDRTVVMLDGYAPSKISPPWLDRRLEAVEDVTALEATAFVAGGHRFWSLTGPGWTVVYEPGVGWHERVSYGSDRWRTAFVVQAFGEWLAFDRNTPAVLRIDATSNREALDPLVWEVWSRQIHAFPSRIEFNRAAFDFETGVGRDAGISLIQTDPRVFMSYSDDGGRSLSTERDERLGSEGEVRTVQFWRCGTCGPNGRQWRLRCSDPVNVSLMGGAWDGQVVG